MSVFADLIAGFRGLFRARWEELAEASSEIPSTQDVLAVLRAQLAVTWVQQLPGRASFELEGGERAIVAVAERPDE